MLRAILCERIALYFDSLGSVTYDVPPIKRLLPPSVWPSRSWYRTKVEPDPLCSLIRVSGMIRNRVWI